MEEIERLQKQWERSKRFLPMHASMSLENEGLVLGAKTVLAKRNHDGSLALDANETKLLTLLSTAYGCPIDRSVIGNIRCASKHARAGNLAMAAMHVALSKLPRLVDPEDSARRLFIANGLIDAGVDPRDIWSALDFASSEFDVLTKLYNQNEPRNPAGDGRISGEWAREIDGVAERASRIIGFLGDVAFLGAASGAALLGSTVPAGRPPKGGAVPGRPDLRFQWDEDENRFRIFRDPDPVPLVDAAVGAQGVVRDRRGRKVARILTTGIRFELKNLPPPWPSPEQQEREPQKCPLPGPDKTGRGAKGEKDRDYEDRVKALINEPPTPRGIGFQLTNPVDGLRVYYDDCQHRTGILVEAKGTGYAAMLAQPGGYWRRNFEIDWVYQATRQVEAGNGRPIEWHFAEKGAADFARHIFPQYRWLAQIRVVWTPWKENARGAE